MKFVLSICLGLMIAALIPTGDCRGQDDVTAGRDAFSRGVYPWYDAETDGIQPIEMIERTGAKSTTRDEIPLATPNVKTIGSNWNWGSGTPRAIGMGLSAFTWVLIVVGVAVVVAVLVWAFLRMEPNFESDAHVAPRRSMAESIKELPFELESESGDFRQIAQQAMGRGDYTKAMIYLFSHVLVSLDQQGLIILRKGKTNRQYLKELRLHRPLANYFQRVMVPFEAVFFGDHEPDPKEFENCWNELEQFHAGVRQTTEMTHA